MIAAQIKAHLSATLGFALLFVALLTIGTTIGDCDPGSGCHDHDGRRIGHGVLVAAGMSSCFGVGVWLVMATVRMVAAGWLSAPMIRVILLLLVLAAAWISFDTAMHWAIRLGFQGD